MYKSDYFTEEQMTKYKMQMDADKVWMATLQFFTNLYTQRKVYGVDRAANSGFDSAALVHKYPPRPKQLHRCQYNQRHHNVRPLHQES